MKNDVSTRQKNNLTDCVSIELEKTLQPQQVKSSWDNKSSCEPSKHLPPDTKIIDIFDDYPRGLLVLGEPGSGKTITLLQLAEELIDRAEKKPTKPIPIIFDLSSWKAPNKPIYHWLTEEIGRLGIRKDIAEGWLENKQILPFLDGLDEVESKYQKSCVEAINRWQNSEYRPQSLVISCRKEEYEKVIRGRWKEDDSNREYDNRLLLPAALVLNPLTDPQIQEYLENINQTELWLKLKQNKELKELVQKPLWLNFLLGSKEKFSWNQDLKFNSVEQNQKILMDAFVRERFARDAESKVYKNKTLPTIEQTKRWLVYLADKMPRGVSSDFAIERIQPSWVIPRINTIPPPSCSLAFEFACYMKICGFVHPLFFVLGTGLHSVVSVGYLAIGYVHLVLNSCIYGGAIYGVRVAFLPIKFEATSYSFKSLIEIKFIRSILSVLIILTLVKLTVASSFILNTLIEVAFIYVPATVGILSLKRKKIEIREKFNEGISKLISDVFLKSTILFLIVCLGLWIHQNSFVHFKDYGFIVFIDGLFGGLGAGIITGLIVGGSNIIKYFVLRFILFCFGHTPWNYSRFLDYCSELLFLQRIGGRYRFLHRSLQEYFRDLSI